MQPARPYLVSYSISLKLETGLNSIRLSDHKLQRTMTIAVPQQKLNTLGKMDERFQNLQYHTPIFVVNC